MTEQLDEVPLSVERILAAILATVPEIEVPLDILLGDLSEYQLKVDQRNEGALVFKLVSTNDAVPSE